MIKHKTKNQNKMQVIGKKWKQRQILFSWAPKSLRTVTAAMTLKDTPIQYTNAYIWNLERW